MRVSGLFMKKTERNELLKVLNTDRSVVAHNLSEAISEDSQTT